MGTGTMRIGVPPVDAAVCSRPRGTDVVEPPAVTTFLFTDIEGSAGLWERDPARMQPALARHDAISRSAVEQHRGTVVKMTGDGMLAAFSDPLDAIEATLQLQQALAEAGAADGLSLRVRCGLHAGVSETRDHDVFGSAVNRAARIMGVAHGGQVVLSQAVTLLVRHRLPAGVTLRDLGAVRLRDLAGPEQVSQLVHPRLRQDFPALRSLEHRPNNLPQQVTSFIGRERELTEVRKLLASARLLTLVGAGGLGKTRLSLQVAADVIDDYPDGVWFVELAPLADGRLVAQAVGSALGVKEEGGRPLVEALASYVADRSPLIILDNCEHVIQACAELATQLLQSGPRLRLLATSREALHVAGETSYPLPALGVPAPAASIPLLALAQFESVRLFADRAVAAQPAFRITAQNAAAVTAICRHLDGIPLAIELAAARVRALSVEQIATHLSDRFRLLTGGDRTALPRQRTLRACIDWSYDLLTEPERVLLRRLAVFAGGFALDAAVSVAAGDVLAKEDVLDLLGHVVEKSLVEMDAEGQRYRLLETVREYAQLKLAESEESSSVRDRHLAFYVAMAQRAQPELIGPQRTAWFARLDLERENLLAAHAWCHSADSGGELGLRLASALRRYWFVRGFLGLGLRVTVEALGHPAAQSASAARCQSLYGAGEIASWMARYEEALQHLTESVAIARALGDTPSLERALQPLALAALGLGNAAEARKHLEEALVLARELGKPRRIAGALTGLAQVHRAQGELVAAERLYREALALARELGDPELTGVGLLNLAMAAIGRNAPDDVGSMLAEALAIAEDTGSRLTGQSVLEVCAGLAAARSEWARAAEFFGAAEAQTEETGLHRDPADEAFLMPLIAKAREALGAASAEAEAAGRALTYDGAISRARTWLGGGSRASAA